ncbi:MAG: hypothetical protein CMH54_02310 [Myxococcales bacterium]|nr:hypothetical protein [Myxococcales bacterium]
MSVLFLNLEAPVFSDVPHPKHNLAPLDLGTAMASVSEQGHSVAFIETATGEINLETLTGRLRSDPAELVVIRPSFEALPHAPTIAAAACANERAILWVGPPASHAAEWLLSRCPSSLVSTGESDRVPLAVLQALHGKKERKEILGIAFRDGEHIVRTPPRPLEQNIDRLPIPRHDLLLQPNYRFHYPLKPKGALKMGYLLASRGCPYSCIFCSEVERASFGKPYRNHSAGRVASEMRLLSELGATGVYFEDDLFALDKPRFLDLAQAIQSSRGDLSWCAQVRASDIDDEIAQALKNAGCTSVACGIETGSDRLLKLLKKGTTTAANESGVRALNRAGIQVVAYLIIGIPEETAEDRRATLRLAEELKASMVQLHIFASYPGTQAMTNYPELGAQGGNKFIPAPTRSDRDDLLQLQRDFYRRFYLRPDRFVQHVWRRWPQLWANPGGEIRNAMHLVRHALNLGS